MNGTLDLIVFILSLIYQQRIILIVKQNTLILVAQQRMLTINRHFQCSLLFLSCEAILFSVNASLEQRVKICDATVVWKARVLIQFSVFMAKYSAPNEITEIKRSQNCLSGFSASSFPEGHVHGFGMQHRGSGRFKTAVDCSSAHTMGCQIEHFHTIMKDTSQMDLFLSSH